MLGPFASQEAVEALNEELGANEPLLTQYTTWIGDVLHGDLGTSFAFKRPVGDMIATAMVELAQARVRWRSSSSCRSASSAGSSRPCTPGSRPTGSSPSAGLSATAMPEFVGGIVLIIVFGLWLDVLPISARWPPGTSLLGQIQYLLMPALALVLVLFGYIARMARAGTVAALDADYTRTAMLKGLPRRTVVRRHVLRNALLPTITVIATQVGYMIGGLVVVERLFNYNGVGELILNAARNRDYPQLQSTVLVIGVIYLVATLAADILYSRPEPADPVRRFARVSAAIAPHSTPERGRRRDRRPGAPRDAAADPAVEDRLGRDRDRERLDGLRVVRLADRTAGPVQDEPDRQAPVAVGRALLRHRPARPRHLLPDHRRRPRRPHGRAARDPPRRRCSERRSGSRWATSAGWTDDFLSRIVEAVLAIPLVIVAITTLAATGASTVALIGVIAFVFAPIIARTVRAAVLAERELEYVTAARFAANARRTCCSPRSCPTSCRRSWSSSRFGSATPSSPSSTLSFLGFGPQPPSPDWGLQIADGYRFMSAGFWWESLFPALAIASLVIAVNLISDGIQQAVKN